MHIAYAQFSACMFCDCDDYLPSFMTCETNRPWCECEPNRTWSSLVGEPVEFLGYDDDESSSTCKLLLVIVYKCANDLLGKTNNNAIRRPKCRQFNCKRVSAKILSFLSLCVFIYWIILGLDNDEHTRNILTESVNVSIRCFWKATKKKAWKCCNGKVNMHEHVEIEWVTTLLVGRGSSSAA